MIDIAARLNGFRHMTVVKEEDLHVSARFADRNDLAVFIIPLELEHRAVDCDLGRSGKVYNLNRRNGFLPHVDVMRLKRFAAEDDLSYSVGSFLFKHAGIRSKAERRCCPDKRIYAVIVDIVNEKHREQELLLRKDIRRAAVLERLVYVLDGEIEVERRLIAHYAVFGDLAVFGHPLGEIDERTV